MPMMGVEQVVPEAVASSGDVPLTVFLSVVGMGGTIIGILWRRIIVLEDRNRSDLRETLPAIRDNTDAQREVARALRERGPHEPTRRSG